MMGSYRSASGANRLLLAALVALIVGLFWWALRDIPLAAIQAIMSRLDVHQIGVLLAVNLGIIGLFTFRWWFLIRALGYAIPFFAMARIRLAAFGVTYFTPGPQFGGEPLQVYLSHRRHHIPLAPATTAVTLDKILELIANFTFLVFGVIVSLGSGLFPQLTPQEVLPFAFGMLSLPMAYILGLWIGFRPLTWITRTIVDRTSPQTRGIHMLESVALAEDDTARFSRQQLHVFLLALLFSLATWVAMIFEFSLALRYLGHPLSIFQVVIVLTAARIAFLFPLPAGLGTLEASQVVAIQAIGLNPAVGVSLSLLIRARDVTFGAIGLLLAGVNLPSQASPLHAFTPAHLLGHRFWRRTLD